MSWIIQYSVTGKRAWQLWGGPYTEEVADSVLAILNNPRFDYRKKEV